MDWRGVHTIVAGARRQLWMAALICALVTLVALVRYGGPGATSRQRYLATQALTVSVLPADAGGIYARNSASQLATRVSGEIVSSQVLASSSFARAVAQRVAQNRDQVVARFGASATGALATIDARAAATALSASHVANRVTITARWSTAAGAWALVTAAGETLEADPPGTLGAAAQPADGATLRIVRDGTASDPVADQAIGRAALAQLVATLLLGLLGGMLVAALAGWWEARRSAPGQRQVTPSDTLAPPSGAPNSRPGIPANADT